MWATFPTMLIGNFPETASQPLPAKDEVDALEHRTILQSLQNHQPDQAEEAMRNHILSTARYLNHLLAQRE